MGSWRNPFRHKLGSARRTRRPACCRDRGSVKHEEVSTFRSVTLPFIVFTAIWGSTWIVIRSQLGLVPAPWSVTYRFVIASTAMALIALIRGERLPLGRGALGAAIILGFTQF